MLEQYKLGSRHHSSLLCFIVTVMVSLRSVSMLIVATLSIFGCQAATPIYPPPGASAMAADTGDEIVKTASLYRTRDTLAMIQHLYSLPSDYFHHRLAYLPSHYDVVLEHLQHPEAKFSPIFRGSGNRYFASPAWSPIPGEPRRSLLLLKISQDGDFQPIAYTEAKDEVVPGHGMSLMDLIDRHATLKLHDLESMYSNLRFVRG